MIHHIPNDIKVVRHYWGLTWPTLIVGGIIALASIYAIYKIYTSVITMAQ
jgi:hypothetical protein